MNYYFDEAPFTTYGEFNPTPVFSTTSGGHTVKELQPSQSIRFRSSSTSVAINSYYSTAAGRTYVLLQDGVEVGSYTHPATGGGAYADRTLATGLTGTHEYEILCITPIFGNASSWYDSHLVLDADSLSPVAHPNRFVWGSYSDSINAVTSSHMTDSGSAGISDTRYGCVWIATQANGQAMYISGVAGGKVANTGRDSTANIPTTVDGVLVEYGINDAPDLPAGNATFQTAYGVMIDNIRARIGASKPIVCLRPYGTVGDSGQANIGTLIQAAIVGKADVTYEDTDGWITETTAFMPDNIHPNAAGYAQLAIPLAPVLLAASGEATTLNATTFNATTLRVG